MLSKLLAVAPCLLAARVAAAPAIIERDNCQAAVTVHDVQTVTVLAPAGAAAVTYSEKYSPQQAAATVQAAPQATPETQAQPDNQGSNTPYSNNSAPDTDHLRQGSYESSLYFTNWGIYGANFQPQQIPADKVSRILFAFADIASDGEV
jgi:chitinase